MDFKYNLLLKKKKTIFKRTFSTVYFINDIPFLITIIDIKKTKPREYFDKISAKDLRLLSISETIHIEIFIKVYIIIIIISYKMIMCLYHSA